MRLWIIRGCIIFGLLFAIAAGVGMALSGPPPQVDIEGNVTPAPAPN